MVCFRGHGSSHLPAARTLLQLTIQRLKNRDFMLLRFHLALSQTDSQRDYAVEDSIDMRTLAFYL